MSGILLPGQENKPQQSDQTTTPLEDDQSSSGLILPKGYGSKEKEAPQGPTPIEMPEQAAPSQTASTTSAEGTAQASEKQDPQAGAQRPQMNFKFPPRGAQIQCPNCGTAYTAPVFTIIDLGANPELKNPLLSGQVNVGVCPSCNSGIQLGAPIMVHEPEHEFAGVYLPPDDKTDDLQRQKIIGDLTQMLMRSLPAAERKGYLFQPQQFLDWSRFVEKLWGFEGVTPEMLKKQSDQSGLIQTLLGMINDETALDLAIERNKQLIDRDLFAMLEQMIMVIGQQGQEQAANALLTLRSQLLEKTEAGAEVKDRQERIRSILEKISSGMSREELLQLVIEAWQREDGVEVVSALGMAAAPAMDYQFLMALTQQMEKAHDVEERASLNELREFILELQAQQQQAQQAMVQQTQAVLQEVLQADDTAAALSERADLIDETFLGLIAANIQAAQKNGATAATNRLRQVYEQALTVFQEKLPPETRLIQQLLAAPDPASARKLLQDNRELVTKEFHDTISNAEQQLRQAGHTDQADRLKSMRGQVALMI